MITAQKAKKLTAQSKVFPPYGAKSIDKAIKKAAKKGEDFVVEFIYSNEVDELIKYYESLGFKISQCKYDNDALTISWKD
jgi:hypothetical protein